jgi:hypothetical protein
MRRLAEGDASDPNIPVPIVGRGGVGDPDFGPWYGANPLSIRDEAINVVPAAAKPGPQRWAYVAAWNVL